MEISEVSEENPGGCVHKSDWLHSTIKGVDEKMKAILNALEDYESPLYGRRMENIAKMIQDLCISYSTLAEDYDHLKTVTVYAQSVSPSNPESTVEDGDSERADTTTTTTAELESIERFSDSLVPKDDSSSSSSSSIRRPVSAWSDGVMTPNKISKLVEENTQIQVELIRRNCEKKETIRKLQNQVSKLRAENNTLRRGLSYLDRNKEDYVQDDSPRRKAILLERFFKCSP